MRRSLEAVLLMGTASVLALGLGALRMKLIAVELGATGVGSLGILMAAVTTMAVAFGCGLGVSGISAIAGTAGPAHRAARDALRRGTWMLAPAGGVAAAVAWALCSEAVGVHGHEDLAPGMGVAVAATIFAARSSAELSAMGRVRHLAVVQVVGALVATIAIPPALQGSEQLALTVALAGPPVALAAAAAAAVHRYARMPRSTHEASWRRALASMIKVGVAVSASTVLVSASQLFAASWVTRSLDLANTGYFQASWSIAHLYLTFMLSALTAEYLPRLSRVHASRRELVRTADDQVQLMIALAAPVIAWLVLLAPLVMHLLYAEEFQAGTELLRLQLLGDVFKVYGWTLAYMLLAREARGRYFIGELSWNVTFVVLVATLTGNGLVFVGFAYAVAYLVYLGVTVIQTQYRPSRDSTRVVSTAVAGLGLVYALLHVDLPGGAIWPTVAATGLSLWGLLVLRHLHRSQAAIPSREGDTQPI